MPAAAAVILSRRRRHPPGPAYSRRNSVEPLVGRRDLGDAVGEQPDAVRLAPGVERCRRLLQQPARTLDIAAVGGLEAVGHQRLGPRERGRKRRIRQRRRRNSLRRSAVQRSRSALDLDRAEIDVLRAQIADGDAPVRLESPRSACADRAAGRAPARRCRAAPATPPMSSHSHAHRLSSCRCRGPASIYICKILNIRRGPCCRAACSWPDRPQRLGLLQPGAARAEAVLTDDGLYRQPWFLESFLELADDLAGASEKKKRFAIMWELRGCPYCKETHLVNFAKPEIEISSRTASKSCSSTSSARAR